MSNLVVMKFGGTSVGNARRMQEVAEIVSHSDFEQRVVVVSAMSGITDLLLSAAHAAADKKHHDFMAAQQAIQTAHHTAIEELALPADQAKHLTAAVNELLEELAHVLESIYALGELSNRAQDLIVSFGERLNIHLVAAALAQKSTPARPVETTKLIVTSNEFGNAQPQLDKSTPKATRVLGKLLDEGIVPVVTGFIGATTDGITTTLGRGGSDYSATILGYCLSAKEVWIWTDVSGVMTADPRLIPHAHTLPILSYEEAAELSYFGAKVLHPLTMVPAALKNIPIIIKNTFQPDDPGTKISKQAQRTKDGGKAITTMKNLSLITVQGKGMTGVPGVAAKVFGTIAAANINVLFISQASSEYNISLVVRHDDGTEAMRILQQTFGTELAKNNIETVKLENNLAIVAVVGEGMKGHPGVAGKTFASLGEEGINIIAIAQGSSERNISLVIAQEDIPVAVRAVHDAFHLNGKDKEQV